MKNAVRIISIVLALVLALGILAACGDKKGSDTKSTGNATDTQAADGTKAAEVAGEKQTGGVFTMLVPSDMKLAVGDVFDKEDPKKATLSKSDNESYQLRFSIVDAETAADSIATTKEMNSESDPKDVEFKTGEITWKGVAYVYAGTSDCFMISAEIDGRTVLVGSSFLAYDSDVVNAVLASLELAPAE